MNAQTSLSIWAQWLNDHDIALTAALVMGAFSLEMLSQRGRPVAGGAARRSGWLRSWQTNALLYACALALSLALAPLLSPLFSAALAGDTGLLGGLNLPFVLQLVIGVLLLDLFGYASHRLMHAVPLLWRLHQVHHSDQGLSASTHFRQHPLAILFSLATSLGFVALTGIHAVAWVAYGLLALPLPLWQHAALEPTPRLDRWLGGVLVTPTQHRVHHRPERWLHDSNYGAVFSVWDRLLGSLRVGATTPSTSPASPHAFGLHDWPGASAQGFTASLMLPFKQPPKQHPTQQPHKQSRKQTHARATAPGSRQKRPAA